MPISLTPPDDFPRVLAGYMPPASERFRAAPGALIREADDRVAIALKDEFTFDRFKFDGEAIYDLAIRIFRTAMEKPLPQPGAAKAQRTGARRAFGKALITLDNVGYGTPEQCRESLEIIHADMEVALYKLTHPKSESPSVLDPDHPQQLEGEAREYKRIISHLQHLHDVQQVVISPATPSTDQE